MAGRVPSCPVCTGVVKPDIVFFGEPLPHRFFLHVVDFPMADLLLILGTSLEVWGLSWAGRRWGASGLEAGGGSGCGVRRVGPVLGDVLETSSS